MKQWLRKIATVLIAIITLGIYIPPALLTIDLEQEKGNLVSTPKVDDTLFVSHPDGSEHEQADRLDDLLETSFTSVISEQAREQALIKFGPRIAKRIEVEFTRDILPQIEDVLEDILAEAGQAGSIYFELTENPTPGYGEKIFNLYDYRTKQDIARFDVRRENRPLEGHWFNFHYHLSADNFEAHYDLGDIYWDTNIPPKWMA